MTCLSDEFTCSDGRGCIVLRARCDGTPDCDDLSDEEHCGGAYDYQTNLII